MSSQLLEASVRLFDPSTAAEWQAKGLATSVWLSFVTIHLSNPLHISLYNKYFTSVAFIRGKFAVKIKEAILSASKTRIYFQLQRAAHRLKVEADSVLAEAGGLTTAQAAIMSIIAKDGPVAQKYIAEKLSQRESAITAMAARLLKAGYITKIRSQADARAWELEVTDAGCQALDGIQKQFAKLNAKLDDKIDHSEMQRLASSLDKIIQAMDS